MGGGGCWKLRVAPGPQVADHRTMASTMARDQTRATNGRKKSGHQFLLGDFRREHSPLTPNCNLGGPEQDHQDRYRRLPVPSERSLL